MANNYFQFKQFIVYQDRCALKVSTDSCVFGAWLAKKLSLMQTHLGRGLDIGAGSGLLMLMLAQQFQGELDGVEIDRPSFEQATENLASSPWHHRLKLYHEDVKLFSSVHRYDMIFSNPPFYESDLKSPVGRFNVAKHSDALTLTELLEIAERNLSEKGMFAVLLPWQRAAWFEQLAATYGLFVSSVLRIRQSNAHPVFRAAFILTREHGINQHKEELLIRDSPQSYSMAFTNLLQPYYLYL